jgi:hypothetical protein
VNQEPATENDAPPDRPPGVVLIARTHWLVGTVIALSIVALNALIQKFPVQASPRTYVITLSLAGLYLLAGTLVWFGLPFGRFFSKVCGLIYLARPAFGSHLWNIMESQEYRAHFARARRGSP